MPTVAITPAVQELLDTAGQYEVFFTDEQLREVVREHMPHLPQEYALIALLDISDALSRAGQYDTLHKHKLAEAWRELALVTATNVIERDRLTALQDFDTSSSASRQHYIDTGRYLTAGEAQTA